MKKIALSLAAVAALGFSTASQAQVTECSGVTAPAIETGFSATEVGGAVETVVPTLTTTAVNLTHTQFIITKKGQPALASDGTVDTTGSAFGSFTDVIMGADDDGVFNPGNHTRYGYTFAPGDTLELTAVGFNLGQLRRLVQAILQGSTPTGATCCQVIDLIEEARGFCGTLSNIGIVDSNAIVSLAEVLDVFDAFSDRQLSIRGLLSNMSLVNNSASSLPAACTDGQTPICYGIDLNARYGYKMGQTVSIEQMNDVSTFAVFPNPVANGVLNVLVDSKIAQDFTITVYNTLGQAVAQEQLGVVEGARTTQINTANLSSGMYFVELSDGQNRQIRKVSVN